MLPRWLRRLNVLRPQRLPSTAELDRRLAASRDLAERADVHIARARRFQEENNMAAVIAAALGIEPRGGKGHADN